MHRPPLLASLALIALLAALAGCSSKGAPSGASGAGMGTVNLRLTDAPADFDHVYLDIQQVSIHSSEDTLFSMMGHENGQGDGGWFDLATTPGIHDLLELRNGVFTTIGTGSVPAGHYDQVRLKLGAANSVVIGGVSSALKVPSGMQSGYKLIGEFDVPANELVDIGLDFDAQRSIHQTGNGKWMLKPVCRTFVIPLTGGIAGSVVPDTVATVVYAIQVPDTIATTETDVNGHFVLSLLPPGTYSVHLAPIHQDFEPVVVDGVVVTAGHITDLGLVTLPSAIVVTPTAVVRPAPMSPAARAGR